MSRAKPRVSVLMAVYNGLPYLKEAVDSILSQTFGDFEFVIIDDGSTDSTGAVLDAYSRSDGRVRVLKNAGNMGNTFSLNRGLGECSGEYIMRMDSDDVALRDKIERQVLAMDSDRDISALGSAVSYIDASGRELGFVRRSAIGRTNLNRTPLIHSTVMMRRDHLVRNGLRYNEKYPVAEDYFLWLSIAKVGKISALDDVLLKYRITEEAARVKNLKKVLWNTLRVKKDAVLVLKIRPCFRDILRVILELLLLAMPARVVLAIYIKTVIKTREKIKL